MIAETLSQLADRRDLSASQMQAAVEAVLRGQCSEVEIAALLTALRVKSETVDELVGAARAMRAHMTPIHTHRDGLLDTCGTGGDGLHTFNISTAAALVVAAAGVPVAKHGNRAISSASGSADVLRELGVNVEVSVAVVERSLNELGIGFCYAPLLHAAMRHVAPVRRALRFRTLFNLVGPLTNPAGAEFQLLGVSRPGVGPKLAAALSQLGCRRAFVVCGSDGLDEITLSGPTQVWEVCEGSGAAISSQWLPEQFGLPGCRAEELRVRSAAESAAIIRAVLAGQAGPARNIVLANAAAAFLLVGRVRDLSAGVALASETIDRGAAQTLLEKLVELTAGEPPIP